MHELDKYDNFSESRIHYYWFGKNPKINFDVRKYLTNLNTLTVIGT